MAIRVEHDWKAEADGLEFDDLEERLAHYQSLRDGKLDERRKATLAQIRELMAKSGLSAEDILDKRAEGEKKPAASAGKKMAPKYRDPANAENVWTGQGRAPKWMPADKEQWEDFLIAKPEKAEAKEEEAPIEAETPQSEAETEHEDKPKRGRAKREAAE